MNKQQITTTGTAFMVLGIGTTTPNVTGRSPIVSTGSDILVQVMPSVAKFTSELHLFSPERRYITTNRDTRRVINLGSFPVGTELIFGIVVRETGKTFMMGKEDCHSDGFPHILIQIIRPGVAVISFKDFAEEKNENVDNSMSESEIAIADILEYVPQPFTAKGNLVFGNFNVPTFSKSQQNQKAV
ncbi:hypothetical protein BCD67_09735 [Oscillatoriales cyanobacterium USR001]|nr:hypothetical protein BCD67_09735 [Oscillatoriales cyanobacterium USR001]